MVTIKTIENIKLGSRITLINGIYAILLGIFYMIFFDFIMRENFRIIGSFWRFFTKYNPEIGNIFTTLFILIGSLIAIVGICIICLSLSISKKKEKTTWAILFLIGIFFWSSIFIIALFTKNIYTIVLSSIGWISFIIGMLIPIRYYTHKSYEEY